jgi:hypothetical protein
MRVTFQNVGMTLSIGLYFSIMVTGLAASLPSALTKGLMAQGDTSSAAAKVADMPAVSGCSPFLGYNPMRSLLGPTLKALPAASQAKITDPVFFANLISAPFHNGLTILFTFSLGMCLVAAAASWLRGKAAPDVSLGEKGPTEAVFSAGFLSKCQRS